MPSRVEACRENALPSLRIIQRVYAIERAENAGIPVTVVDYASFPVPGNIYEESLLNAMERASADLFVLAGDMRILGDEIARKFSGKMIDIYLFSFFRVSPVCTPSGRQFSTA